MSTPAPAVLTASADKAGYAPGEQITVTAAVTVPFTNLITVNATLPDGTVVNTEVPVTVSLPVAGDVQFYASDGLGGQFSLQSGSGGNAVLTAAAGSQPAA